MSKTQFLALLLIAKLLFCFISWYIIGGMTKLGDTQDYLSGLFLYRNDWTSTAYIMSFFGNLFSSLVGYNVVANFPLMLLAFAGIYISTKKLQMHGSYWFLLLVLMCLPSTLMWTSIHSKEAVLNFLLGVFAFLLIHKMEGQDWQLKKRLVLMFTMLMIAFFKPLYVPAMSWFLLYALTYRLKVQKVLITLALSFTGLALFSLVLFVFYQELAMYLQIFHRNFSTQGELTRIGNVWQSVDEFLIGAGPGLFISFVGPTFMEAVKKISLLPFFIEGVVTLFVLIYLVLRASIRQSQIYIHTFFMLFGGVVLFLLAQYPVGYFNPGSALRYKQSFLPFLFVMLFYFAYDLNVRRKGVS